MAKKTKKPKGLQYSDIVKAQGGMSVNRQTGAVTYASSHSNAKNARDIDAVVDETGRVIKQAAPVPEYSGGGGVSASPDPTASTITPIIPTSPVISSEDNAKQFNADSNALAQQQAGAAQYVDQKNQQVTNKETGIKTDKGLVIESSGDPLYDKLQTWQQQESAKIKVEAEKRKKEYAKLYDTSLRAIDKTTEATIAGLNSTYAKRVDEQMRINELDVARVKAYGLSEGGRYVPVMFGDAITAREEEGADKITSLEAERNSLIAQAQAARDEGKSKLLRQKMEDLERVDNDIRNQLKDIANESMRQYEVLRTVRKEVEAAHQAKIDKALKQLASIAPMFIDDFDKMDSTGKDSFINQLVMQTGLDYASVYGILNAASVDSFNQKYDREKKGLELEKARGDVAKIPLELAAEQALINQRNASAAASYASAARSRSSSRTDPKREKSESMNNVEAYFDAVKGRSDNKVSPEDWETARRAWAKDGYSVDEFDKLYRNSYINKNHEWDYGFDD